MDKEIQLHIVLLTPPAGVDFGLQKGAGHHFETVQVQRSNGSDLHFHLSIPIKSNKQNELQFSGPFVQGPAGSKFIYIDIGAWAGQAGGWERRLKIPLYTITTNEIEEVLYNSDMILHTRVPGTHKNGGPNCATPKPFDGWQLVKR